MDKRLLLIATIVFSLDGSTKWLVKRTIPVDSSVAIIPGLFRLTHLENRGVAFSMFAGSLGPWPNRLLVLLSLAAVVIVGRLLWKRGKRISRTTVSLALFLGGTLGNLYDRVTRGMITDFLDVFVGSHHWPAFNVADSAIVMGALLLLSEVFLAPQEEKVTG